MFLNPNLILDTIYPVGSLYLTTNETDPSKIFGGKWEQITSDAYLKIVDSDAGSLGGTSSEHKIPTSSMPSHKHVALYSSASSSAANNVTYQGVGFVAGRGLSNDGVPQSTKTTGDGEAYYPYYYGIYIFKRIA